MTTSSATISSLLVCLAIVAPLAESAITCRQVSLNLWPCVPYIRNEGRFPMPPQCCRGVQSLKDMARTTYDRQTTCRCIKRGAAALGPLNVDVIAGIPQKCGIYLPYPMRPSTDCSKVT